MEEVTINITENVEHVTINVVEATSCNAVLNTTMTGLEAHTSRELPIALDTLLIFAKKVLKYLSDLGSAAFTSSSDYETAGSVTTHLSNAPHYSHLSQLTADANHRTVSDAQITAWTGNIHFLGIFATEILLNEAYPTAFPGDYAFVDIGENYNALLFVWDVQEGWILGGGANTAETDPVFSAWLITNPYEASGAVATHAGEYEHLKQGQMWLDDYSSAITRVSDSVIRVDVGTIAGVDMFSKVLQGRLIRWTDSTGATVKYAVIIGTQADGFYLNLTIYGNTVAVGDTNWRWSSHLHRISTSQIFIPGELLAESEDVGMEILMPFKNRLIAVSSVLKNIATGGSESLKYNLYANGSALFSTDRQHTTNADLMNQLPTIRTLNAGDRITLRITESTGTTTKAQGLTVILYYFDFNQMEALIWA